jgi:hypothetical protein
VLYSISGISRIDFDQAGLGGGSTFTSLNEVVVEDRGDTPGSTGDMGQLQFFPTTTGWAGVMDLILGENPGNRYSAQNGSVWIGVRRTPAWGTAPTRGVVNIFGSYWDAVGSSVASSAGNRLNLAAGNAVASIVRQCFVPGTGLVESCICYGDRALIQEGSGDQANLLVASQTITGFIVDAGTIGGLLLSDVVATPPFTNSSDGLVVFLDPRVDYDLLSIIDNFGAVSTAEKHYTSSPRFVSKDSSGVAPNPIDALTVDFDEVDETTESETPVFNGVTDGTGRTAGTALRRQLLSPSEETTYFSHRMRLQGGGFRQFNELLQYTDAEFGDTAVDRIAPDFEGEYGE